MTDTDIQAKLAELEQRILYLEMMHRIEPKVNWLSTSPTQGCSQEEIINNCVEH